MIYRLINLTAVALFCIAIGSARAQEMTPDDVHKAIAAQMARGNLSESMALANKIVQLEPRKAESYVARAQVYAARKDFEKAVVNLNQAISLAPDPGPVYQLRGTALYKSGDVSGAAADFDKFLRARPDRAPYHWQRGIALYQVGRFEDGRIQFETHQTVNDNDVENAAWHFLCVAKHSGFDKARASLLKVGNDPRVPMMEIYALYQGKGSIDQIFEAAKKTSVPPAELERRLYYANLYVGLFFEAREGDAPALEYIKRAVEKGGRMDYMGDVARVHADLLEKRVAAAKAKK